MVIHIQSQSVSGWHNGKTSDTDPPHVRIFASEAFTTSDNKYIPQGSLDGGSVYLDVTCVQVGTTLTVPAFDIDSTIDALGPMKNSRYNWYWFTGSGALIGQIDGMQNLAIPASIVSVSPCSPVGTCASWVDLVLYNAPSPQLSPDTYPTQNQVAAMILAALG